MLAHVRQGRGVYFQEESFSVFKKDLKEYLGQWKHGLKKCANRELAVFMERLDHWQMDLQNAVLLMLCREICDRENLQYYLRGSGLSYVLLQRMKSFLRLSCESSGGMPYLR